MDTGFSLQGRRIGAGHPCFIIAEAGVNHNGRLDLALKLVDAAREAGADAVKFQAFVTAELVTPDAPKAGYHRETTSADPRQAEMLKALELGAEDQSALKRHCERTGILYLCTPYDVPSADLLDRLDVAAYKIASTDTTNLPFLQHVASKGRPVICSTGMCTMAEVEQAVQALQEGGLRGKIALLHCTSQYPVPVKDLNLRAMETLSRAFRCPVGFSDHAEGTQTGAWATAVGACILEKHLTLDRSLPGPDHRASVEPGEMKRYVEAVRGLEAALGDGVKTVLPSEASNKTHMQKSLVARRGIRGGERIVADALTCKRPATGLSPSYYARVVGRRAARDIRENEILTLSCVEWES